MYAAGKTCGVNSGFYRFIFISVCYGGEKENGIGRWLLFGSLVLLMLTMFHMALESIP
jgi:hypothetical protein